MRMAHAYASFFSQRNPFWDSEVGGLSNIESSVKPKVIAAWKSND
jgi:hypothetical protein